MNLARVLRESKKNRQPVVFWRFGLAASALLLFLAGCATVPTAKKAGMFWPPPPLVSRIKFVKTISTDKDMKEGSISRIAEVIIGKAKSSDRFDQPIGLAISPDGKRLYVSDYGKRSVVVLDFGTRRMTYLGGGARGFKRPFGVAVDKKNGNVYVADTDQKSIHVFDSKGKYLREIRYKGLERPTGVAVDSRRNKIYVADSSTMKSMNHMVYVFDMKGTYLKSIGGRGNTNGKFLFPTFLAVDEKGNLYVTDTLNGRVQVFDPEGKYLKTFGKRGNGIGRFDKPKGVVLDTFSNVYVVDSTFSNVQIFNQQEKPLLYFAGRGRIPGLLFNPTGIAIGKDNRIYVADTYNGRVAVYQLINTKASDSYFFPRPPIAKGGGGKEKK